MRFTMLLALLSVLVFAKVQTKKKPNSGVKKVADGTTRNVGSCPLSKDASLDALIREGSKNFGVNYPIAEDCYRKAMELYPTNALAAYNFGLAQLNQGKAKLAEQTFRRTIQINPKYGDAYFGLGSALYDRGGSAIHDAAAALSTAVKLSPRMYAAYNQLGNVRLAQEKLPQALNAYQYVIDINPRAPEGYANLGRVLAALGRHDDAIKSLMHALGLAPANGQLYYEIGVAFKNAKKEGAAKRFFLTATRLLPSHAPAHYQLGELRAGTVFSEDRDVPGALRSLKRAIAYDNRMAEAYMSLGMIYWGQGQLGRAEQLLARGLAIRPFAEGKANLGIVLSDMGKYDQSIRAFQDAMALNPLLAEAPKCLGDTFKHVNRWNDAIAMYKKALEVRPDYWEALNDLVHALQHTCEWKEWAKHFDSLQEELGRQVSHLCAASERILFSEWILPSFRLGKSPSSSSRSTR